MKNNYRVLGTITDNNSGDSVRKLIILDTKSKKKALKEAREYRNTLISLFGYSSVDIYVEVYQLKDDYENAIAIFSN